MEYIHGLARHRKTVRKFSGEPVNLEEVIDAIEVALQAPSGKNAQPWRFLVITDPEVRRQVREASEGGEKDFYERVSGEFKEWLHSQGLSWQKPFLEEAPLLVLVFSEARAPYSKESVWLAIGYLLLALEEKGLVTVTYTPSNTKRVLEALDIPTGFNLEAVLPIGYSEDDSLKRGKRSLEEMTYLNRWDAPI